MSKKKVEKAIEITLPITPMLDMSFQLLSFFLVTFKVVAPEGQMLSYLPKVDDASASATQIDNIIPEEKEDEYKIQVYSANGELAGISYKPPGGSEDIKGANPMGQIYERLKSVAKPAKDSGKKGPKVTIESQNDLKYAWIIELMDVCRRAGFESVGVKPLKDSAAAAQNMN